LSTRQRSPAELLKSADVMMHKRYHTECKRLHLAALDAVRAEFGAHAGGVHRGRTLTKLGENDLREGKYQSAHAFFEKAVMELVQRRRELEQTPSADDPRLYKCPTTAELDALLRHLAFTASQSGKR